MLKLLLTVIGLLVLGGGPVWLWDHHGPIGFTLPIPFLHPHIGLPDSLATRLANASAAGKLAQANLDTCHGNLSREDAALRTQEAAVQALATRAAQWQAESRAALQAREAVAESWRQKAASVASEKPVSPDLCVAAEHVLREAGQ